MNENTEDRNSKLLKNLQQLQSTIRDNIDRMPEVEIDRHKKVWKAHQELGTSEVKDHKKETLADLTKYNVATKKIVESVEEVFGQDARGNAVRSRAEEVKNSRIEIPKELFPSNQEAVLSTD